jgi:hypothetical protein
MIYFLLICLVILSYLFYRQEIKLKVIQGFLGGYWRYLRSQGKHGQEDLVDFVEEEINQNCSYSYYKKLTKRNELFKTRSGDNVGLQIPWELVLDKMNKEVFEIENKKENSQQF